MEASFVFSVLMWRDAVFFFEFLEEKGWGGKSVLSGNAFDGVACGGKCDLRVTETQIGQIRGDALPVILLEYTVDIDFIIGDPRKDHGQSALDMLMRLKAIYDLPKPNGQGLLCSRCFLVYDRFDDI